MAPFWFLCHQFLISVTFMLLALLSVNIQMFYILKRRGMEVVETKNCHSKTRLII